MGGPIGEDWADINLVVVYRDYDWIMGFVYNHGTWQFRTDDYVSTSACYLPVGIVVGAMVGDPSTTGFSRRICDV
jgi:hypothetical protein